MHVRRSIAAGCFAVAMPLVSAPAQDTLAQPPKWSVSVGADPTHLDLHTRGAGLEARMVGNLTRSWQSANSRWARQISLMVGTDAPRLINPSGDPQCDCLQRISATYVGLTAGGSYDLFKLSRFTPYLKAGTGLYYRTFGREPANGMIRTSELIYYQNGFSQSAFSLGVNAGLGLNVRLWSREVFIEQTLHSFDVWRLDNGLYPINIGVRF
jgi:hypothetical protein